MTFRVPRRLRRSLSPARIGELSSSRSARFRRLVLGLPISRGLNLVDGREFGRSIHEGLQPLTDCA